MKYSSRKKVYFGLKHLALIAAQTAYLLIFFFFHREVGIGIGMTAVFPVVLAALLYGRRGALIMGGINAAANALFLVFIVPGGIQAYIFSFLSGSAAILFVGYITGWLKQLREQVMSEKEAVESAHSLLDEIVTGIAEGVGIVDENERITFCNPAYARILGANEEEIIGRNITDFIIPEDREIVFSQTMRRKLGEESTYSIQIQTPGGERRTISVSVSPRFRPDGNYAGAFGVLQDITERIRREEKLRETVEEKEYLLKEINHRVKNNLGIISSLISLESQKPGNREVLSDIEYRIQAIGMVHEKLYKSDTLSHIRFRDYAEDLLKTIFLSFARKKISIENNVAEDIFFSSKKIVPLGLIINEIATNSLKYGFTGTAAPRFSVGMKQTESGSYELGLENNGPPLPETAPASGNSLGMQLIEALVRQLHGTLTIRKTPSPQYTITFP